MNFTIELSEAPDQDIKTILTSNQFTMSATHTLEYAGQYFSLTTPFHRHHANEQTALT